MHEGGGQRPLESPRRSARPRAGQGAAAAAVATRPVVAGRHGEVCVCVCVCACERESPDGAASRSLSASLALARSPPRRRLWPH